MDAQTISITALVSLISASIPLFKYLSSQEKEVAVVKQQMLGLLERQMKCENDVDKLTDNVERKQTQLEKQIHQIHIQLTKIETLLSNLNKINDHQ
jgi:hypothetical protein